MPLRSPLAHRAPLAIALALTLGACHPHVSGNGVYAEADCGVGSFNAVKLDLGLQATVEVRPLATGVTCVFSGDANLVPNIKFIAPNGVLQISDPPHFDRILPLTLRITTQALTSVEASDAGAADGDSTTVAVTAAATDALTVVGHDRSQIAVFGPGAPGGTETVDLSEAAIYFGFGYPVAGGSVALAGRARAEVRSSADVTGTIRDSSTLLLEGGASCASLAVAGAATCAVQ
jgi:Putative auto-transporter adhesin, head GIN domain